MPRACARTDAGRHAGRACSRGRAVAVDPASASSTDTTACPPRATPSRAARRRSSGSRRGSRITPRLHAHVPRVELGCRATSACCCGSCGAVVSRSSSNQDGVGYPALGRGRDGRGEPTAPRAARRCGARPLPERVLEALRRRVGRSAGRDLGDPPERRRRLALRPRGRSSRRRARCSSSAATRRRRTGSSSQSRRSPRCSARTPDARLLVTGRLVIAARAARRPASASRGRVEAVGRYSQADAPALFRRAHVLLHTKVNDPCPSVVLEAMASGAPGRLPAERRRAGARRRRRGNRRRAPGRLRARRAARARGARRRGHARPRRAPFVPQPRRGLERSTASRSSRGSTVTPSCSSGSRRRSPRRARATSLRSSAPASRRGRPSATRAPPAGRTSMRATVRGGYRCLRRR